MVFRVRFNLSGTRLNYSTLCIMSRNSRPTIVVMVIHTINSFFDDPGKRLEKVVLGFLIAFTFTLILASIVHFIWPTYSWPEVLGSAIGAGLGTGIFYAARGRSSRQRPAQQWIAP